MSIRLKLRRSKLAAGQRMNPPLRASSKRRNTIGQVSSARRGNCCAYCVPHRMLHLQILRRLAPMRSSAPLLPTKSEIIGRRLISFSPDDARRTDGCHCQDDDTADMLYLSYQERKPLRSAAIRLWKFVHQVVTPRMRTGKWPEYTNDELSEFEAAIDGLDQATEAAATSTDKGDRNQQAISPEADPQTQTEPDGPCHPYTWRHNGLKLPEETATSDLEVSRTICGRSVTNRRSSTN